MPARDFGMLQEFFKLEPYGPSRDNLHAAQLASLIANAHFKGTYQPDKFMWKQPASEQDKVDKFIKQLDQFVAPADDETQH